MKIEERIITGIFVYSDDITYTENDFVVSPKNFLYVVKKEVTGRCPDDGYEDYYSLYGVSDQDFATYDDFKRFLKDPLGRNNSANKIVSLGLLSQILDNYMMGINGDGVITSKIFDSEIWFTNYLDDVRKVTCTSDPFDIILEDPEINNAYFSVENSLVRKIISTESNTEVSDRVDEVSGVLRQYTYRDENSTGGNFLIRVQELIDPISGLLFYRYSINTEGLSEFDKNRTSSWRGTILFRDVQKGSLVSTGRSGRNTYGNSNYNGSSSTISDINTNVNNAQNAYMVGGSGGRGNSNQAIS